MLFFFRDNSVLNINPMFEGRGYKVAKSRFHVINSLTFNKTTELWLFLLISINSLTPIQTLTTSSSFMKILMPISVATLILFQRSILWAWEKLDWSQLFPSLVRLQVFSAPSISFLNRKAALGRSFLFLVSNDLLW